MTETTEERFCGGCGDKTATVDREGRGPCCQNLQRWHRGRDGLYNATERSYSGPEDEDEPLRPPHCPSCGSYRWRITAAQIVNTGYDEEGDGGTIYVDTGNYEHTEIICADCGDPAPRYCSIEYV